MRCCAVLCQQKAKKADSDEEGKDDSDEEGED
jgi:hypothetical protein